MSTNLADEAKELSIADRILLVEEIWDSIAADNGCFELTEAQKKELDRRLEAFHTDPSQGRTWEEIKSEFLNSKLDPKFNQLQHRSTTEPFAVANGD